MGGRGAAVRRTSLEAATITTPLLRATEAIEEPAVRPYGSARDVALASSVTDQTGVSRRP